MQLNIKSRRLITTPVYQIRSHKTPQGLSKEPKVKHRPDIFNLDPPFYGQDFDDRNLQTKSLLFRIKPKLYVHTKYEKISFKTY